MGQGRCHHVVSGEEERRQSKHKLARGLFKMADLKPSMQCKPNPTLASFALSYNPPHPRWVGTHDKTRKYTWVRSLSEIES